MIKLSNGARIYDNGRPDVFLMAGIHGEERAPVMALMTIIKDDLKNVWVLPCLNIQGHKELNRYCGDKNLNGEFKEDTTLDFMQELMEILHCNKPKVFVDMHEDVCAENDYIWSHFDNEESVENKVRVYCKRNDVGLLYQPNIEYYNGCSETWARSIGIPNCYTTETKQYAPFDKRLKANKKYIDLFLGE
jgi:predicted deacylase